MIFVRCLQSLRSPWIRCPTTSKALNVFSPSLLNVHASGRSRSQALSVLGVRSSRAIVSVRLSSIVAHPLAGAILQQGWIHHGGHEIRHFRASDHRTSFGCRSTMRWETPMSRNVSIETIEDFLRQKRIAMVGLSRESKDFSVMLFEEFRRRGYDMVPVNPG